VGVVKEVKPEAIHAKRYVLVTVDTVNIDEAHKWFKELPERCSFELLFVADMKASPLLEKPIGFIALIKLDSTMALKPILRKIKEKAQEHGAWKCEFMRVDWIDNDWLSSTGAKAAESDNWRKVSISGEISFQGMKYFVTKRLCGEKVQVQLNNSDLEIYHQGSLIKVYKVKEPMRGERQC
jgi:hypothetical protein